MDMLQHRTKGLCLALLAMLAMNSVLISGCMGTNYVYPVTSGSHRLLDEDKKRIAVWSNHSGAAAHIIGRLQQGGHTVVERARLLEIFNEQKIRLSHTPDDEADVLRVGRLAGADRIEFVEVTIKPQSFSRMYVHPDYGGAGSSGTVYHVSVSVRSVNVENGEVRWSGTAFYNQPINNPEGGVLQLIDFATARATCGVEEGYEWIELTSETAYSKFGCQKK